MQNGLVYLETNWIETSSGASGWSDQDFDHLKGSFWCEDACLHVESRGLLVGWFVCWLVGWLVWLVSCKIAGFPMYSHGFRGYNKLSFLSYLFVWQLYIHI